MRSDDPSLFPPGEYPDKLVDSTSAADSPDLELFSTPFAYKVRFHVQLAGRMQTLITTATYRNMGKSALTYTRTRCMCIC